MTAVTSTRIVAVVVLAGTACVKAPSRRVDAEPIVVQVAEGRPVGFDDVRYDADRRVFLVPSGWTGRIEEIGADGAWTSVRLAPSEDGPGTRKTGLTSVDRAGLVLVAVDRSLGALRIRGIGDAESGGQPSVATATEGPPDLVRVAPRSSELWVTEPDREQIERFAVDPAQGRLTRLGSIPVAGGPESLAFDPSGAVAFTHAGPSTLVLDAVTGTVVGAWTNGCTAASGSVVDPAGFLLVGCDEGGVSVVRRSDGALLDHRSVGASVDHVAFSPTSRHLYVPEPDTGTMSVFGVSTAGRLSLLGTTRVPRGAECVATDDAGTVALCAPEDGAVVLVRDPWFGPRVGARPLGATPHGVR